MDFNNPNGSYYNLTFGFIIIYFMKKLILLFILLLLCACSNEYKKLGYSVKAANVISSLGEKDQVFFSEYDENLDSILSNKDFKLENLRLYIQFSRHLNGDDIVRLVNDGTIGYFNYGVIKNLTSNKDFVVEKINEYLDLYKDIKDVDTVIFMAKRGIDSDVELVSKLIKDKGYIVDNLPLYLRYKNEKEEIRSLVEYVNTLSFLRYYEDNFYAEPDKYGTEVLVNKYYYLGPDYVPTDLIELKEYGYGSLRKVAYDAYVKMYEAAKKDGVSFYVTSSYRSYKTQVIIYNRYLTIDPQEKVDIYSARPGFSDHQTGYTVDILTSGHDFDTFYLTPAAKWLADNAYKYGFILRYPKGLEQATGYEYEAWHFRYVGDVAEDVYKSGLSYDEYFAKYIEE